MSTLRKVLQVSLVSVLAAGTLHAAGAWASGSAASNLSQVADLGSMSVVAPRTDRIAPIQIVRRRRTVPVSACSPICPTTPAQVRVADLGSMTVNARRVTAVAMAEVPHPGADAYDGGFVRSF